MARLQARSVGDLSMVLMTVAREKPQGTEPIESNPGVRTNLKGGPSVPAI
jgi:hypothetical protein